MADAGHDYADAKLAEFQAEVAETYRQAEETARKRLEAHLKRFAKADDEKRKRVESGDMGKQAYADWRRSQMMTGYRYQQVLEQVADAYARADQVAVDAINGKLPQVYAENANYGGWQACEATGLNLSWSLMDADTAQHMLTSGQAMFAMPALDVAKDKAWNRKLMASQLTQGVLLGESIPKLAKRMERVTGSNYATAVRTARTAVTGAENAGRVESYRRAGAMGIRLQKEWLATLDGRTRHSHRQLDREKVPEGEKFSNGCRYPGDPEGRYAEICNCRCTLVPAIEGIDQDAAERWSRLPAGMTYEQWKGELAQKPKTGVSPQPVPQAMDKGAAVYKALSSAQVGTVESILAKSEPRAKAAYLANEHRFNYLGNPIKGDGAYFTIFDARAKTAGVRLRLDDAFEKSKRPSGTTWFHEFGHNIDHLAAKGMSSSEKRALGISPNGTHLSSSFLGNVFGITLRKEANDYINERSRQLKIQFKEAKAEQDIYWLVENGYVSAYRAQKYMKGEITFAQAVRDAKHTKAIAYKNVADEISALTDAQKADVSDLFCGATLNKCDDGWRHRKSYWKPKGAPKDYECIPLAHEGFAEFYSAYTANPESLEMLQKYFPESSIIFEELLRIAAKGA